jgi:hypothetical protein
MACVLSSHPHNLGLLALAADEEQVRSYAYNIREETSLSTQT